MISTSEGINRISTVQIDFKKRKPSLTLSPSHLDAILIRGQSYMYQVRITLSFQRGCILIYAITRGLFSLEGIFVVHLTHIGS